MSKTEKTVTVLVLTVCVLVMGCLETRDLADAAIIAGGVK
jgi:hypothetical protein